MTIVNATGEFYQGAGYVNSIGLTSFVTNAASTVATPAISVSYIGSGGGGGGGAATYADWQSQYLQQALQNQVASQTIIRSQDLTFYNSPSQHWPTQTAIPVLPESE